MEINTNLLNNLIDILLLKTHVIKNYKENVQVVKYDKKSIKDVSYTKEKLNWCYKITTGCSGFSLIYYVFVEKITGLNNLVFDSNTYPEPILLTYKSSSLSKKDLKTHELNIFYEKELAFNYPSNIKNTIFTLMNKDLMNGVTSSLKKTCKTSFKKNIDNDMEIKIFYTKEKFNDIYGVIYQLPNGSIGTTFTVRFYKSIKI